MDHGRGKDPIFTRDMTEPFSQPYGFFNEFIVFSNRLTCTEAYRERYRVFFAPGILSLQKQFRLDFLRTVGSLRRRVKNSDQAIITS